MDQTPPGAGAHATPRGPSPDPAAQGSGKPAATPNPAGAEETIYPARRTLTIQDLSADRLLSGTKQVTVNNQVLPSLAGIPLLAKLGQGGMGAVYLGLHPRLQKEVAIKVLPFQLAQRQPELVQRFFREARIAAQIQSPNLVSVQDVNEEKGLCYLVMEYVPGLSAGQYLKQLRAQGQTGLPESVALDLCIAATRGLAAAHERNIIHRDLKPDNIMLPRRAPDQPIRFDEAKLMDLGLARSEEMDQGLTGSHVVMGTLGFLAPEQAMDAKSAGPQADVFGMCATLYMLLCGRPPFDGNSSARILMATLQEPPPPPLSLRPDLSPATAALLDRGLAKSPTARPQDALRLLAELQDCRARAGQAAPELQPTFIQAAPAQAPRPRAAHPAPAAPRPAPGRNPRREVWRRPWLLGLAAGLGFLLLLLAVWGRSPQRRTRQDPVAGPATGKPTGQIPLPLQPAPPAPPAPPAQPAQPAQSAQSAQSAQPAQPGRVEEVLAAARKAVGERRFVDGEALLQQLDFWSQTQPREYLLTAQQEKTVTALRGTLARGLLRELQGAATPQAGQLNLDDEHEGRMRWAVGLLARNGGEPGEVSAWRQKVPEYYRLAGLPGAQCQLELPNLAWMDQRLKQAAGGKGLAVLARNQENPLITALDWEKPLLLALRIPPLPSWSEPKEWQFALRLSAVPGKEAPLRMLLNLLRAKLTAGHAPQLPLEEQGDPWILSNNPSWSQALKEYATQNPKAALRRQHADLSLELGLEEWVDQSRTQWTAWAQQAKPEERPGIQFLGRQLAKVRAGALKLRVEPDGLWVRGRFTPRPGTDLAQRLGSDSLLLEPAGQEFLPAQANAVVCAQTRDFLIGLLGQDLLRDLPLPLTGDPARREESRQHLLKFASLVQAAGGPRFCAALLRDSTARSGHVVGVAGLAGGPFDAQAFQEGLRQALEACAGLAASGPQPGAIKPLLPLEFEGFRIGGLQVDGSRDEVRFASEPGRLFLALGKQDEVLSALQETLLRRRKGQAEGVTERGWYRRAAAKAPRQASLSFLIDPLAEQRGAGEPEAVVCYLRALDGMLEAGLFLPSEVLRLSSPDLLPGAPQEPKPRPGVREGGR